MPDGGASFFAWLGTTEVFGATVIGESMIVSSAAWATAAQVTAVVAMSAYQQKKARRAAISNYNASLEDRLVMLSTTDGQRSRCYGRVRNVDGILFKGTHGTNKEWYTLVIAVAGHEIDGFETVYFGDAPVTLDASGWVTTAPYILTDKPSLGTTGQLSGTGTASISVGTNYLAGSGSAIQPAGDGVEQKTLTVTYSNGTLSISGGDASEAYTASWQTTTNTSNARVRFYTGTATQDLSSVLAADFPGLITSGVHKFAGIACMVVNLRYSPDSYPTGVPSISAVFRGAKVYDPRTATTAWTQNPALIARDWATYTYGGAIGSGDLHNTQIIAAANACDTSTAYVVNGATTTLPLYRCDIVCQTDADPWTQYEEIIESMAGKTGWSGGLLGMVAGAYRSPVATITEDWLSGVEDIKIVPEPPEEEAVNTYRPKIANASNNWVAAPVSEVVGTAYVTADGRTLAREVTLGGVSAEVHAQHICGVLMRDSRESLTVVLPCNMRAFQLELFDVVSVTLSRFGWSAKTFEVLDKQFSLQGGVILTLKETVASIFTPNATFTTLSLASNSSLPAFETVPAMGTISAESGTATLSDGTQVTRAKISWPSSSNAAVTSSGSVEVQYWPQDEALPSGDWIAAPAVSGAATSTVISGFKSAVPYLFKARYKNALGVRGAWSTQISHTMSTAPLPSTAEWGTLSGRPANLSALSGTESIQNSQITISGGAISGIGTGSGTTVANNSITISSGAITGIGTGSGTAVANSLITLSSAGALSGAGGGSVTISGLGYSGDLNATYGATAGANIKDSLGAVVNDSRLLGSLVDSTVWQTGVMPPTNFTVAGTSTGGSNAIVSDALPDGSRGLVWRATSGSAAGTSAEGGFVTATRVMDGTKVHRYSVWVRSGGSNTSGVFYFGLRGSPITVGGAANSSPYFLSKNRSTFTAGVWYLAVGYVFPAGYTGAQEGKGGLWSGADGTKVQSATDFYYESSAPSSYVRAFQFSTTVAGSILDFWGPRIDLVDGTEPSLAQMLSVGAVGGWNKITSSNISSYIGSAAIGSAYIGSLTAGNLSVTELSKVVSNGATSGSRIDITSNLIQIYDGTTVRVKLGIF